MHDLMQLADQAGSQSLGLFLTEDALREALRQAQPVDAAAAAAARRIALGRAMIPIVFERGEGEADETQVPGTLQALLLASDAATGDYSFERYFLDLTDF